MMLICVFLIFSGQSNVDPCVFVRFPGQSNQSGSQGGAGSSGAADNPSLYDDGDDDLYS